ncbi:hypothetical protein ABZ927_37960 [Streptomyces massasporeus]
MFISGRAPANQRPCKLTIVCLVAEAGLRRNRLTHKHTGLKDLFYALVNARAPLPAAPPESVRARAAK